MGVLGGVAVSSASAVEGITPTSEPVQNEVAFATEQRVCQTEQEKLQKALRVDVLDLQARTLSCRRARGTDCVKSLAYLLAYI